MLTSKTSMTIHLFFQVCNAHKILQYFLSLYLFICNAKFSDYSFFNLDGNYTVFVQEDKQNGHILLRFSVTDSDESPNAAPFTFDIRAGNEDNSFRVVQVLRIFFSPIVSYIHSLIY